MRILVIGSGGREHALVWKLAQSPRASGLYCAPGNPGIARWARCVPIQADNLEELFEFAKREPIDLTVVGPEVPLTKGIVNRFQAAGLRIVGPTREAAEIESSKSFSKTFMTRHGIPTAKAEVFDQPDAAIRYIQSHGTPIVVKADGLAAGKGVVVAADEAEAVQAVEKIMREKVFGAAGNSVVIEDCLEGEEVSFLVFTDGETIVPMPPAQDYKRIFDRDQGPNTGGMGAYSPAPVLTAAMQEHVLNEVIQPTVDGLNREGRLYRGILYAGLMLTREGPKVLEFNARFGDPETQVLLSQLETDLGDIFDAIARGSLNRQAIQFRSGASVCVVLTARGYPGKYETQGPITGIDQAESRKGVTVFHAGTALRNAELIATGGRVLGVTAWGKDLISARGSAYEAIGQIRFEGMHFRSDIGLKGINETAVPLDPSLS